MKSKNVFVLLFVVLLMACSNVQVSTDVPLPVVSATNIATKVVPSLTPTLTSTKTPFPTTNSIETVAVATVNAAATTESIRINLINQFPELQDYLTFCSPGYCYGVQSSPNGQWIYLTNFETIEIFNVNGERVGKYSSHDIYQYTEDYCLGYINGVHWSNDERYLYLSVNPCGDGGPKPYFEYATALVRVNLETGNWENQEISGSFKFSPNDEYIIYSSHEGQVQVKSLSTDQEQDYSLESYFLYFGNYVWSPDGRKVVFVGASEDWYADDSRFVIFMIDIENNTILQLYESSLPFYFPVDWVETNKISLKKFNGWGEWVLDLSVNPPTISP